MPITEILFKAIRWQKDVNLPVTLFVFELFGNAFVNRHSFDFNASYKVQVLQNGKVYEIPIKADGQLNVDAVEETNAAALGTSKLPTGYPAETFADVQIVAAS